LGRSGPGQRYDRCGPCSKFSVLDEARRHVGRDTADQLHVEVVRNGARRNDRVPRRPQLSPPSPQGSAVTPRTSPGPRPRSYLAQRRRPKPRTAPRDLRRSPQVHSSHPSTGPLSTSGPGPTASGGKPNDAGSQRRGRPRRHSMTSARVSAPPVTSPEAGGLASGRPSAARGFDVGVLRPQRQTAHRPRDRRHAASRR
jgi:hypothetical protein